LPTLTIRIRLFQYKRRLVRKEYEMFQYKSRLAFQYVMHVSCRYTQIRLRAGYNKSLLVFNKMQVNKVAGSMLCITNIFYLQAK
jgi:hypothetical protein